MFFVLVAAYFLLFLFLVWHNFRLAVILFIIFLPAYLIRVEIGPLPSTALELSFGAIFLVWLIKYSRHDFRNILVTSQKHKILFIAFDLFFIASVASIFISDMPILSFGQWRAYFLEPMILFLILIGRSLSPSCQDGVGGVAEVKAMDLIWALALSTLSISTYSIIQKFTGWGIVTAEWTIESTRRMTAFYSSPNAVGLYLAPVLMLFIPLLLRGGQWGVAEVRTFQLSLATHPAHPLGKRRMTDLLLATALTLSLLAIFFTKSQGAWIGLSVGALAFLFFIGYKKIAVAAAVLSVIFSLLMPSMRQAVLFQDQAGQNRLRLWKYTWEFLDKSPKNFILGTGVRQFFRKIQKPYYDKKVMERLIYPHNIFLNFWTEIGLLGMLAVITILGHAFYLSYKIIKSDKLSGAGLFGALIALVAHGLVDVPYFKNDLAFLFWIIIATVFIYADIYKSQAERA
jgi:O-antigen ligase